MWFGNYLIHFAPAAGGGEGKQNFLCPFSSDFCESIEALGVLSKLSFYVFESRHGSTPIICICTNLVCGGRTPQLKMECYNLAIEFFLAAVFTKCHDVFLCTSVGDLHDKPGVIKIVGQTCGSVGVLLIIAIIIATVIKRKVMRRRQNDEQQPILGVVVDETRNNLQASASGESEVTSGSDSVRPSSSNINTQERRYQ